MFAGFRTLCRAGIFTERAAAQPSLLQVSAWTAWEGSCQCAAEQPSLLHYVATDADVGISSKNVRPA
jgi:hypothetical protein